MTSLPAEIPQRIRNVPSIVSAYNICLRLEKSLQKDIDNKMDIGRNMIYCRILGYLIHFVPGDPGLKTVVQEIVSCSDDASLLEVGMMYFNHYIRAFRANKGRTPKPSSHASHPSFDTIADMIEQTLVEAPQSHADAKKNALIRDGYRCVVTGRYDVNSTMQSRELEKKLESQPNARTEVTECAHIFTESTNSSVSPDSSKRSYAASIWAIMVRFGHTELPDELNGSKVHRLENVMTLVPGFHALFDRLSVWFVPTQEENKYKIEAVHGLYLRSYPEYVTFTTPDPIKFPVPSPNYLHIHAACAKVAHLSGAADCIDRLYYDMDDSTTLDPSGASAEMLEHAIFELQASGYEITV